MRALIVEQGWSRGALAAARALADAGWHVGVGSPSGGGLASSSRACRRRHRVPAAHEDAGAFIDAVRHAVVADGYEVVFGAGEAEVLALSAGRARVPAVVPHAPHAAVLGALDKGVLEAVARRVGLATPTPVDVAALGRESRPFIVKARMHAAPDRRRAPPRIDTTVVVGADAVRSRVAQIDRLGAEAQVQEFHEGALLAYSAVTAADGSVVGDSMQRASRIWPPGAGASCRARTEEVDDVLAGRVTELLASLGWFGLAELQFVVPDDDVPRLIDLNGRFYGSLSLAVAAGANLPALWAALATGREARRVRARAGCRYQWLEGDLRRGLAERRGGLVCELVRTGGYAIGATHSILHVGDPLPAAARLAQASGAWPAKGRARVARVGDRELNRWLWPADRRGTAAVRASPDRERA